ncbi:MAG TPA: glycosyltransferase family 4 protein [Methanomicrobiales archaeon]|nr:glycosyltransferase family 4 protein [Methanomicrobiales archaeon]
MKLCFIADGRSIHTQRWAEHFGRSHEVHLITYDPSGRSLTGVTEHVIPSFFRNLYLGFWPRHLRILRLIRRIDPDLVHAHFITKYGFHLPLGHRWPTVVSAWGDDILILPPKSLPIRAFTGRVLKKVDLVYAVSQDLRNHIVKDFGIPPGKVIYLPIGIDTVVFSPGGKRDTGGRQTVVLFSNRGFYPVYDTRTLLAGFGGALKEKPSLSLVLKGTGPEKGEMQELAASLHIGGAVTFRDRSPYSEVPDDLRSADIFVSTATSDGTPVSVLEAMSTGLPCIATRVGGVPEWIEDGENGMLIPPRDPAALTRAILSLASDPALRDRLGARARETVRARGDWGRLMTRVEDDYKRLMSLAGGEK